MLILALFLMTLFVAYANGANDNFKGVATLYGSNTTGFQPALWIGTIATLAGGISSVFLAAALVHAFSGKGLVPDEIAGSPDFMLAVAAGAASTVMLATVFGFPISTTHALTGALAGAGFVAVGSALNVSRFGSVFFLPLLLSPVLSIAMTMPVYKLTSAFVSWVGIGREMCICLGPGRFMPVAAFAGGHQTAGCIDNECTGKLDISIGTEAECVERYDGSILGVTAQGFVDVVHYASAAAVSFARGLNDTPKIVALLLVVDALDIQVSLFAIALAMAVGGLINARRVAETMSKRITGMNTGQALVANLVTAFLVIGASRMGMPVSTTHVSVGAITGIGIVNGSADRSVIASIFLSWVLTLPIAAAIAGIVYAVQ